MIRLSLFATPESRITVNELRSTAQSAVIAELEECGYTVLGRSPHTPGTGQQDRTLEVTPGPALLRVTYSEQSGSVQCELKGPLFGRSHEGRNDAVLWMRIITLGLRLDAQYDLTTDVSDPEYTSDT